MSYTEFKVGDTFPLPIKAAGDGGIFQYDINGAMFILKLSKLDIIAIEAFRTGRLSLGIFTHDNSSFFLYKIDGIFNDWGDCPFDICQLPANQHPDITKSLEKQLNLYLVDSQLNVLLAMRSITMSDDFWNVLTENTKKQLALPKDTAAYQQAVQLLWSQLTSSQMAEQAAVIQDIDVDIPQKQSIKQ